MLYNTYVYIRPERFFLSTQKCNSLYRHGHSSVWIPGTSGCCERAWTTTTRLSLLHNKMQTLNSSKSSVLYQLEFQIMLSKVYIQTPLVRGMYLTSLQGRTEGSVSQVGCGTSWRVTRGCRSPGGAGHSVSLPGSMAPLAHTTSLWNLSQENKRVHVS